MEHLSDQTNLFSTFTSASMEDWITAATAEVRGKNPIEALEWNKGELNGPPYYDKSSLPNLDYLSSFSLSESMNPYMGARGWYNMPAVNVLDEKSTNLKGLLHLQNGADGILFDVQNSSSLKLQVLLQNIDWTACTVSFYVPDDQESFFENLSSYLRESKSHPTSIRGFFLKKTYPHYPQSLHNVINNLKAYTNFHVLGITSQVENPADQISELLSRSVSLIEQLTQSGSDINLVLRNVFFSVPIGNDFFIEIAKLKALRLLWFQVAQAYGSKEYKPSDLFIHAHSEPWQNSEFQPHENMLKATTASLAAILGGCNALTSQPSDEDDERLSRVARNVSNVLREESHLDKVADPTAGSYYIESLVHSIALQAWEKFTLTISKG